MADNFIDRKDLVLAVAALLKEVHGELFGGFTMSEQVWEAVRAAPGLVQSDEVATIVRYASGFRPSHTLVANALSRGKARGFLYSPFKGVWGSVPVLTLPATVEVSRGSERDSEETAFTVEGHVALLDREDQAHFEAWETEFTDH